MISPQTTKLASTNALRMGYIPSRRLIRWWLIRRWLIRKEKATISPRTVRRRGAVPVVISTTSAKTAPAAASSRPRVFGPQLRPIPQIDVEQHQHDVLISFLGQIDGIFHQRDLKTNIHRFATKMQILEGYDEGIRLSGRWTFQSLYLWHYNQHMSLGIQKGEYKYCTCYVCIWSDVL